MRPYTASVSTSRVSLAHRSGLIGQKESHWSLLQASAVYTLWEPPQHYPTTHLGDGQGVVSKSPDKHGIRIDT